VTEHVVGGLSCSDASDLAAGFVLGALEAADMAAVRAHLAGCPESHPEFAELGSVTPALLASVPQVEPPAGLGGRILAAARDETQFPATDRVVAPASERVEAAPPRRIERPGQPRRDLLGWFRLSRPAWAAAGVAAVLAIAVLGSQVLRLQGERDALATYERGVAAVLAAAAQPGAQIAVLTPGNGTSGPAGIAAVGSDGAVNIAMHGLAQTSGSQVYEAWTIVGTSNPQPIGSFTVGSTGSAVFATTANSSAGIVVALTLEPGPGAKTPTLPIIAIGAAQAKPG